MYSSYNVLRKWLAVRKHHFVSNFPWLNNTTQTTLRDEKWMQEDKRRKLLWSALEMACVLQLWIVIRAGRLLPLHSIPFHCLSAPLQLHSWTTILMRKKPAKMEMTNRNTEQLSPRKYYICATSILTLSSNRSSVFPPNQDCMWSQVWGKQAGNRPQNRCSQESCTKYSSSWDVFGEEVTIKPRDGTGATKSIDRKVIARWKHMVSRLRSFEEVGQRIRRVHNNTSHPFSAFFNYPCSRVLVHVLLVLR